MKRKFPRIAFILLIILNLLNLLLCIVENIDLSTDVIETIVGAVLASLLYHIIFGGLIYLMLPASIYLMLCKENRSINMAGYITAIVTVILQIICVAPTYVLVALLCIEGADMWIAFIYYAVGGVLTIAAIIYSKIYLKLKAFKRRNA